MKTARGEDASNEFASVTGFYGDDFDQHRLSSSLEAQFNGQKELRLHDIISYLRRFSSAEHIIFSEVITLLKLTLLPTPSASIHSLPCAD